MDLKYLSTLPDDLRPKVEPAKPGSLESMVKILAPTTSEEAKQKIVELWLAGETNEAMIILRAYKIGLDEGRRDNDGTEATARE